MSRSSVVVIDASFALYAVLNYPESAIAARKLNDLIKGHSRLVAPHLWMAEVTSALHRLQHTGRLSSSEAHDVLEILLTLDLELVPCDAILCREAYELADQLGQSAAYDCFYLALARNLGAELCTCDKRLGSLASEMLGSS
jgi:predicted nucleic acid-binding protein